MARIINKVVKGLYRDSVQLLKISSDAKKIEGVIDAAIVMGTDLNKKLLSENGLLTSEGKKAGSNDLIIALKIEDNADPDAIISKIMDMLKGGTTTEYYYTIDSALKALNGADIALISIPGEYVKELALELIDKGIHLHIFSDHVPLKDEVLIKKKAVEKNILVMGPEAGTSIISGVGLGFANAVKKGPIGIISAAGTGLQEVSVLLTNIGLGISHGIGVGGRDLREEVGGLSTFFSIKLLEREESTRIITIISKPPSKRVADELIDYILNNTSKKYVLCLMGSKLKGWIREDKLIATTTLHAATLASTLLLGYDYYLVARRRLHPDVQKLQSTLSELSVRLGDNRYIRGLYTGGTLAYEAQYIIQGVIGKPVYSNAPLNPKHKLGNPWKSNENTIIDLGAEEFTAGRPHPMIDPTIRIERILKEANDPDVGIILLDFVLGYGANMRIIEEHIEAIKKAREIAARDGRRIVFIAHIVGTRMDPQNLEAGKKLLERNNVLVLPSNALAALAAALISVDKTNMESILTYIHEYLEPF